MNIVTSLIIIIFIVILISYSYFYYKGITYIAPDIEKTTIPISDSPTITSSSKIISSPNITSSTTKY